MNGTARAGALLTVALALGVWLWTRTRVEPVVSPPDEPMSSAVPSLVTEPSAIEPGALDELRRALPTVRAGALAGLVVDAASHRPLPEVQVEVAPDLERPVFATIATTGNDGQFVVAADAWRDPCTLRLGTDGYRTLTLDYSGDGNVGVIELAKGPVLRVRVVRAADGTPVPAIPVDIGPSTGSRLMWIATATTDADGVAIFARTPDDGVRVQARTAGGDVSVVLPAALVPEPVTILVPEPREVKVTVVDAPSRAPLPHARLLRPGGTSHTCDEAGTCIVPVLTATHAILRLDAPGYFAADTPIDPRATAMVIEARPTCTLRGRVASDVRVTIERTAATGAGVPTRLSPGSLEADGSFAWHDVPCESHLALRCLVNGAVAASTAVRTPGAGETALVPPIRIEALARVRVRVEGAGPGPVGIILSVHDAQRTEVASHRGVMSGHAEHTLSVPAGRLRLAVMQRDGGFARTELDVPPEADLPVTLRLETGTDAVGTLILLGSAAPPHCEIWCIPLENGLPSRHAWTDAAGRFVLRSLPAGRYQVSVRPTHFSPPGYAYESASHQLAPGDRAFEMTVPRLAAAIRGRITGTPEDASRQAIVHAVDRAGRRHPGTLHQDFAFTIAVPASGPFRVEAVTLHVPGNRGRRWTASLDDVAAGAEVSIAARW